MPQFFVDFLTDPGNLVLDPFAGSNTTGEICEANGRRWIAMEMDQQYLETSRFRFEPKESEPESEGKKVAENGHRQIEFF